MTELIWLLVGLLIGGCLGVGALCCMQINRIGHYEQEITRLKNELKLSELRNNQS